MAWPSMDSSQGHMQSVGGMYAAHSSPQTSSTWEAVQSPAMSESLNVGIPLKSMESEAMQQGRRVRRLQNMRMMQYDQFGRPVKPQRHMSYNGEEEV